MAVGSPRRPREKEEDVVRILVRDAHTDVVRGLYELPLIESPLLGLRWSRAKVEKRMLREQRGCYYAFPNTRLFVAGHCSEEGRL